VRIQVSELRRIIREAAKKVYGWPTKDVEYVYGVPDRMADQHPTDLGDLRLPKGPNSRDNGDDRDLDDQVPDPKSAGKTSAKERGVSTNNKSNNDAGRGGGGGG
jgi:hypothetical protein